MHWPYSPSQVRRYGSHVIARVQPAPQPVAQPAPQPVAQPAPQPVAQPVYQLAPQTVKLAPCPLKVFYIQPTGKIAMALRVYRDKCPSGAAYCNGMAWIGEFDKSADDLLRAPDPSEYYGDPRWPTKCDNCGKEFTANYTKQVFVDQIMAAPSGEQKRLREWQKVPGAMWNQSWLNEFQQHRGPDGLSLCVVCPDGDHWSMDGPASNCTMPNDKVHKCWVRHGPLDCLTVDKTGFTCQAGAGSILTRSWHGFLRNGWFTGC